MVKVLYIEDNDDDVYMLKMRLELLGNFEVLAAEDGAKGCEMAAAEQPDIILMDLEMPGSVIQGAVNCHGCALAFSFQRGAAEITHGRSALWLTRSYLPPMLYRDELFHGRIRD